MTEELLIQTSREYLERSEYKKICVLINPTIFKEFYPDEKSIYKIIDESIIVTSSKLIKRYGKNIMIIPVK